MRSARTESGARTRRTPRSATPRRNCHISQAQPALECARVPAPLFSPATRCAIFLLFLACLTSLSAQPADTITRANQEYNAGHFPEAIELYKTASVAGETSAALFYNLGNASFRTGDLGQAVLNYKRALALEPQHPEAAANLRLARDKARALELRPAWWDTWIGRGSPNQYSVAVAASFWVALFAFAALLLARRRSTPLRLISLLSLAIFLFSLAALWAVENGKNGRALAVVTAKSIEARVATADNASSVLMLPPGSEVKILSTRGDWIYAALPNDLRGWIPTSSAERVRL